MAEAKKIKTKGEKTIKLDKVTALKEDHLPVLKTYKLYIGGQFVRTESGRYLDIRTGAGVINICRASRKDLRESVVAAKKGFQSWSKKTAYNRGQIVYRMAEVLESRKGQFIEVLQDFGMAKNLASKNVYKAIDKLVYYAGWCDKYQQVFSSVNPVAASYFNFSLLEPVGVVGVVLPNKPSLLTLISNIVPILVGGNSVVVIADKMLSVLGINFSEVIHSSDVPFGAVNMLTGLNSELTNHLAGHMDVNAILVCGQPKDIVNTVEELAINNLKRVIVWEEKKPEEEASPYLIKSFTELKTTWHPVGV
ncbi:MAG: aldehyde dehydrogenase family protein [Candidatus Dadabacteria bacterium]|nr:MAG: aldehyde dehydrogenase family protein [Candidatus Dadabacteria bacterium]